MTRATSLAVARVSAILVAILVVFLFADFAVATIRKPKDDDRIAAMQVKVRTNASLARDLAADQKRITESRAARKARLRWLSLVLIAASATFIGSAKWYLELADPPMESTIAKPQPSALVPARKLPSTGAAPVAGDLAFVDQIVDREGASAEAAIPILQAIQAHYRYLPAEALHRVCELTQVTPAQIAGTSTFYSRFRHAPVGEHIVRVCHGTACYVSGARQITEELHRYLHIPAGGDTDPRRMFTVEDVACLGCCSLAPVLMVDDRTTGKLTPSSACASVEREHA